MLKIFKIEELKEPLKSWVITALNDDSKEISQDVIEDIVWDKAEEYFANNKEVIKLNMNRYPLLKKHTNTFKKGTGAGYIKSFSLDQLIAAGFDMCYGFTYWDKTDYVDYIYPLSKVCKEDEGKLLQELKKEAYTISQDAESQLDRAVTNFGDIKLELEELREEV